MKVSCISINTNILLGKEHDIVGEYLSKKLLDSGVTFNKKIITHSSPEQIKEALNFVQDNFIFVIGEKSSAKNYNIKNILARFFGATFTQNQDAVSLINGFYTSHNLMPPIEAQNDYYLPVGAEILKSKTTADIGFMFSANKTFCFLPNNLDFVKEVFESTLLPYFVKEVRAVYQTTTIKTFGIAEKDIIYLLQDLFNNKYKIFISTYPNNLEVEISIRYTKNLDRNILQAFIARIYDKLKKYIYANEDISIFRNAYDLLKLSNKRLAIAESITNGNIVNNFLSSSKEADQMLSRGVVTTNVESAIKNLNINKATINKSGFVSVDTAYEMATNLLNGSENDVVVVTCGEWIGEYTSANQLVCYIAVGDIDGIHVYKNTYSGEYSAIIDNISKSAMFYLIKKIKQNGLFFSQTTV